MLFLIVVVSSIKQGIISCYVIPLSLARTLLKSVVAHKLEFENN